MITIIIKNSITYITVKVNLIIIIMRTCADMLTKNKNINLTLGKYRKFDNLS
jgi:cadmium resistance protein CadD (predicted permease)